MLFWSLLHLEPCYGVLCPECAGRSMLCYATVIFTTTLGKLISTSPEAPNFTPTTLRVNTGAKWSLIWDP